MMMPAYPAAAGGYALVGLGTASQGASGAAVTPAWGAGSQTAGNLLICFIGVTGAASYPSVPSGWTQTSGGTSTTIAATIFWKIAAGSDAAPTLSAVTSGVISAQLAEFSGNSATPSDRFGNLSGAASPVTATLNAADTATGELLIVVGADFRSAARTPTDTLTSNNATITQAGNNNGVSSANHYSFGYCLATTSNAVADTAVLTSSVGTSLTRLEVCAQTFR